MSALLKKRLGCHFRAGQLGARGDGSGFRLLVRGSGGDAPCRIAVSILNHLDPNAILPGLSYFIE